MPTDTIWVLTVPLARVDDFPSRYSPPLDGHMQLQRTGTLLVLSGTRHSRLPNGLDR